MAAVVGEIISGATIRECATKHGIPKTTLGRWLLGEVPDKYRAVQREGLIARIVEADEELTAASSHLEAAKARDRCRFTRWDAERRLSNLFAPRQEISGPGGGPIPLQLDNLERARRGAFIQSLMESAREEIIVEPLTQLPEAPNPSTHARFEATRRIEAEREKGGL